MLSYCNYLTEDLKQELDGIAEEHGFHPYQLHKAMNIEFEEAARDRERRRGIFDTLSDVILADRTPEFDLKAERALYALLTSAKQGSVQSPTLTFISLSMTNFGIFGSARIDFSADSARPITLIEGGNSAGKTTILQALRSTFYGINQGWSRDSSPFHSSSSDDCLELVLHFLDFDGKKSFLRRSYAAPRALPWHTHDGRTSNALQKVAGVEGRVELSTGSLRTTDPGKVDEWVRENLPASLTSYFFFDADGIRDFQRHQGRELKDGLERILRIELVNRLQQDAEYILNRLDKDYKDLVEDLGAGRPRRGKDGIADDAAGTKLKELTRELDNVKTEIQLVRDGIAKKKSQEAAMKDDRERHDRELDELLTRFQPERQAEYDEVVKRIGEADAEIARHELTLDHIVETDLVWQILYPQMLQVRDAVTSAQDRVVRADAEKLMQTVYERCRSVFTEKGYDLILIDRIFEPAKHLLQTGGDLRSLDPPYDRVGPHQLHLLEDLIASARAAQCLPEVLKSLRKWEDTLSSLEAQKARLHPPDEEGRQEWDTLRSEIERLSLELGSIANAIRTDEQQLRKLEADEEHLRRQMEEAGRLSAELDELQQKITKASKFGKMATEVAKAFRSSRVTDLQHHVTDLFAKLTNQPGLQASVVIDAETYEASLMRRGTIDGFGKIGEGEKQILSMALIGGLAQLARERLPVVIDTPFARLDKRHRKNLSVSFLKTVAHQVVLLSTDEEVVREYYEEVKPAVGRRYQLVRPDPKIDVSELQEAETD